MELRKFLSFVIALILALCLVLLPAGISVGALELPEKIDLTHDQIPFQVNPVYRDVLELSDLELPEFSGKRPDAQTMANGNYVAVDQAALEMRQFMKNRTETFEIWVYSDSNDYNAIANEMLTKAVAHTGVSTEGDYLMWHYGAVGADVTRQYENGRFQLHYTFQVVYYTTLEQEAQMNSAVSQLITELGIRYSSDYDKIKAVYDYMCENITYDHANLNDETYLLKFTAYAALMNKTAVCQGYASLFYRLMLELGVDSRLIAGIGGGGAHGWNIVELGGLYYNVDTTWDAGVEEYNFFLKSTWTFLDHYRYLDYESMDFHNDFPMAAEDYAAGVAAEMDPFIYISMCGEEIYWALMRDGSLDIVGVGPMDNYMLNYGSLEGMAPWQFWAGDVTTVTIGEGITEVGNYAFYEQTGLTEVTLPSTLTKIGMNAFGRSTALASVEIPDGVTWIDQFAFENCNALTSVTIPDSVTRIDTYAFQDCDSLAQLDLGNGVQMIGPAAFERCNSLTEVYLPGSITQLGSGAFSECGALETVTIDCPVVGQYAFEACTNLKNVTFTDNVTTIQGNAFANCRSIEELIFPDSITSLTGFSGCSGLKRVELPANLTTIESNAFSNCSALETIVFPENLQSIGSDAFSGCSSLTELNFPDSLVSIYGGAFRNCDGLTEIVFPAGVTSIGGFSECDGLVEVTIPETATAIGRNAFSYCRNLTTVNLPEGITTIGDGAFRECSALTGIQIPSTVTSIGDYAFNFCSSLTEITIPAGVTELQGFSYCENLETVYLFNSGIIGSGAFENCQSLKNVYFYGEITEIKDNAFRDCDSITEIELPDSLQVVRGFSGCDGLTTVDLGQCTRIDSYAFYECTNLSEITIPDTVTYIGGSAFQYCTSLKEITIPASVGEVNGFSFSGLETVYLNNNGAIGSYAFENCANLSTVVMAEGVTEISVMAFANCPALTEITIPASVTSIRTYAFRNSTGLTEITFCGDAPQMSNDIFAGVTATVYYPLGNDTWTEAVRQNYEGTITWEGYGVCEHAPEVRNAVEATCTEPGYSGDTYCTLCGDVLAMGYEVSALGHDFTDVVTGPTCTEGGYTTHTCTVCGEETVDSYVDALGHSFGDWTVVTEPSCTGDGEQTRSCDTCGHIETQVIPAHGHSYVDGFCEHCGEEQPPYTLGDVNDDGSVNNIDAMLILQYAVGLLTDDSLILEAADVNGDGSANNIDAMLVLQYAVGLLDRFN